jgi:Zn-dependent membrane protease YugP
VFAILQLWWPVLALLHLPLLVNTIAVTVFKRISHAHDWELPDDLPQTAGDWLRDRSVAHGLRVIVTDDENQSDGYHPEHRVIFLGAVTHFKSDPVYWAIAAHELGHARIHAEHPLLGTLSRVSMWLKPVFLFAGVTIAIGNVLYARSRGFELAFVFLAGALALRILELFEEAYASTIAYRELKASGHLGQPHLRAVRRCLIAALGTYVSTAAAGGFLLSQWSIVERITGDGRLGELGELTVLGQIAVIVICVLGVAYAAFHVAAVRVRARLQAKLHKPSFVEDLVGVVWRLLLAVLLVLVWNLQGSATWAWCVILAFAQLQRLIVALLMLPLGYPAMKIARWISRMSGPGHHESDELAASRAAGKPLIAEGKRAVLEMAEYRLKNPTPSARVNDVLQLAYLPLIVAIGGGLIT